MELSKLAEQAKADVASKKNPTPKMYLDYLRRNLMQLMLKDERLGITGTLDDVGGLENVANDIKKAAINLFRLAAVLGVDLVGALAADFGTGEADTEATGEGDHVDASVPEETRGPRVKESLPEGLLSAANSETVVGREVQAGTVSSEHAVDSKETLKGKLKLIFREATSLNDVEKTWKNDVCFNPSFDGKDKVELQPDYVTAKKRLAA